MSLAKTFEIPGPLNDPILGELSLDELLGGEVRIVQPKVGYRVSMDTVMLAASVPAQPGERVIEAGSATGGAALCLAHRCQDVEVTGLELQASMVALAKRNIAINGLGGRVDILEGCITDPPQRLQQQSFHHAFANPPYLEQGSAIISKTKTKGLAHMDSTARLKDWVKFAMSMVKNKGTLSFIFRTDRIDELITLLSPSVGGMRIFPLWPRQGVPAKRVIIQARKGMHGAAAVLPGIVLHGEADRYSEAAERILRNGEALDLSAKG